jgi:death on curing protein
MRYLTVEDTIALHDAEAPEAPLVQPTLLDSAVMAPQQSAGGEDAYPTIHLKAAALLRGIACNHAFGDGNKRTALMATYAFYALNGYLLTMRDIDLVHLILDVVLEHWDVEKIAAQLEVAAISIPDPEEDED